MTGMHRWFAIGIALIASVSPGLLSSGCSTGNSHGGGGGGGDKDLAFSFGGDGGTQGDLTMGPNGCDDVDPSCTGVGLGPDKGSPFPLQSDPMKDPSQTDDGVKRDPNGYLTLDASHASFQYLWIANSEDFGKGTVSKLDSKTLREVSRYSSVTCFSLKSGSKLQCDGMNGCCSLDDYSRFQARINKQQQPPHQNVQLDANSPSRTAVDFNGDVWVANRAFGGQSSVSKIANDITQCIDRNKNGKIDTSSDVNADGSIDIDCNGNAVPDDIDDVKQAACTNGKKQEFFGQDDECILFTTNTNDTNKTGRPLALGAGENASSDAWAGTYDDGKFFRIDGVTGLAKAVADLPTDCNPYGLAIDAQGFGWAPNLGEGLCYFNTAKPADTAKARLPQNATHSSYGVAIDRDQNIWNAGWDQGNAYRYTPDRSAGFAKLGQGWWTTFQSPGSNGGSTGSGRGIAVDSRTANSYFAWMARDDGYIVRIDASKTPPQKGMDLLVAAQAMPAMRVAGDQTIGAGVDAAQNVWGISYSGSVATRIQVDAMGNMKAPDLTSAPQGQNLCPAGDTCVMRGIQGGEPNPYTYSDFTGFGLRNFTRSKGSYGYVYPGCAMGQETRWVKIVWDADVPPNTTLTVKARSGKTANLTDGSWGMWTQEFPDTPADLASTLSPNKKDSGFLQFQFSFGTMDKAAVPRLKSFEVYFECTPGVG